MKNKQIVGLLIAAFLLGDAEAVIRGNRKWKYAVRKVRNENRILKLKLAAVAEVFEELDKDDVNTEAVFNKFNERAEFIEIIEKAM